MLQVENRILFDLRRGENPEITAHAVVSARVFHFG